MANEEHLAILRQGVDAWNQWRKESPEVTPDLSGADLIEAHLHQAYLRGTNLAGANLREAYLSLADLNEANLRGANLGGANLIRARFCGADLSGANLSEANLRGADLSEANLSRTDLFGTFFTQANLSLANLTQAKLEGATLIQTNCAKANFTNCWIYGISAWDLNLTDAIQKDLIVTPQHQSVLTVDNLEVAQFIYLLLHSEKVRQVIDTITSKAVLILGRFTPKRKAVLDALRTELRKHDFTPILFDFDKPTSRNLTETVSTLAHMARFVIADITDAKSIPQELQRIVPGLPSLPVQPIILASQYEYSMFIDLQDYPWVLPIHRYTDTDALLTQLDASVIAPALTKATEIAERRKALAEEMAKERKR